MIFSRSSFMAATSAAQLGQEAFQSMAVITQTAVFAFWSIKALRATMLQPTFLRQKVVSRSLRGTPLQEPSAAH